jgi:hypothetical protein
MKRREYIAIMIAYFLSNFLTLALQGIALRSFVLLMRIPLYAMASVIVFYCAIGVFSLNDSPLLEGVGGVGHDNERPRLCLAVVIVDKIEGVASAFMFDDVS